MSLKKKILAIVLLLALIAGVVVTAFLGLEISPKEEKEEPASHKEENLVEQLTQHRDTIYLYYTDEALTDYINSAVVAYSEEQSEYRVTPVLVSGLEYIETLYDSSIHTGDTPDLFITTNDLLEKAYMAGLAVPISVPEGRQSVADTFPESAVRAITYMDKPVAYPFYFETSALVYNKTYLEDWAKSQIIAAVDQALLEEDTEGGESDSDNSGTGSANTSSDSGKSSSESASSDSGKTGENEESKDSGIVEGYVEPEVSQAEIDAAVADILPKTIDDILEFANLFDAPEQVEGVLKWDVSDIFYNYFFVGNYTSVGGINGDDSNQIDIYNEDAIRCMRVYQNLNQFFSIDTKEISYSGVLQDFMDGKIVYTIATSDAIATLEAAKEEGTFTYEYGTSVVPDVSEELASKSMSVTACIAVNGFSEMKDAANDFAYFLACDCADNLYERTGKMPARSGVVFENPNNNAFVDEYEKSVPVPKMIETGNYWVEMEVAFAEIWDGEDENKRLKSLDEQILSQIQGKPVVVDAIDVPEEEAADYDEGEMK